MNSVTSQDTLVFPTTVSQDMIDNLRTIPVKRVGTPYDEIEPAEVSWLWTGYLPLKPVLITGKAGCKKSWFGCYIASVVSRGGIWPDKSFCEKSGVVLITPEDGAEDTIAERLQALGADTSRILDLTQIERPDVVINGPTLTDFALPRDFDILEQAIRYIGASLVVIDPMLAVTGSIGRNEDKCRQEIMSPLNDLCDRLGVCVLMLNHLNKGYYNPKNIETQIGGAFHNASRASYIAEKDATREGVTVIKQFKNNLHAMMPPLSYRIVYDANSRPTIDFIDGHNTSTAAKLCGKNASLLRQNILTLLVARDYGMTPSQIAQQLDVSAVTVRGEIRRMLSRDELTQTSYGVYESR